MDDDHKPEWYIGVIVGVLIVLVLSLAFFAPVAHSASQLVYSNSNFAVVHTEREGFTDRCHMTTRGSPAGDGNVYMVFFPNNIGLLVGDNVVNHLDGADKVTLRVGTETMEIPLGIFSAIMLVNDLLTGKHPEIVVTVHDKNRTVHVFPANGFAHAYNRMTGCMNEAGKSKVQVVTMEAP